MLSTGQTAGDCQQVVCDGNGGTTTMDDPTDLPDSTEICKTNPACLGTPLAPSYMAAATGTNCSSEQAPGSKKHVCGDTSGSAAGTCVECNVAADCAATGNECVVATCTNNVCGTMKLGQSHVLSSGQAAGDCQKLVCDGNGGSVSVDDPTDLPFSNDICEINPNCTGSPLGPSFSGAPAGTDCSAEAGGTTAHVCGDPNGPAAKTCVDCNTDTDCTTDGGTCTNNTCM